MPLKTLHLTNAWHATSGGIKSFYLELLKRANERGHPIRFVVPGEKDCVEEAGPFGRIYYVESPPAPLNNNYRMMFPKRFLSSDGPIVRILNQEQPDVVEINDKYTLPYLGGLIRVSKLRGFAYKPTVIGLSCERMDENMSAYLTQSGLGQWFSKWYMKAIYFAQFDHHITVSHHAAEELLQASRGHKVQRGVWVAPMGVDDMLFHPSRRSAEGRRKLLDLVKGDEGTTLLLYAGRLVPEKNIGLILDTLERAADCGSFRLLVAGSGNLEAEFKAQAEARTPGMVQMLGHINGREALADLYANCDIFVHPNPREPFGIAPLEAMASGMALVAPNSGGVTTYAHSLNAWLSPPDAETFASSVRSIVQDPQASAEKRRLARATAEKYSWNIASDRFLRLYEEIHARVQGNVIPDSLPPAFLSTLGNFWGTELKPRTERATGWFS